MIKSRRAFLKTAALGGASLVIGFGENRLWAAGKDAKKDAAKKDAAKKEAAGKDAKGQFKPNGWVRVGADGSVTLTINGHPDDNGQTAYHRALRDVRGFPSSDGRFSP